MKIKKPEDLQRALQRMMNQILMSDDSINHAGVFAALANAWTNSIRVNIALTEFEDLREKMKKSERETTEFEAMLRGIRNVSMKNEGDDDG